MKTIRTHFLGIIILMTFLMASGISFAATEPRLSVSDGNIAASSAPGYCGSYGGSSGYEYITGVSYTKNPSGTMTITVTVYITNKCGCTYGEPCSCYDNSPEYVHVWVDWNGDKVFEYDEKVIDDALTGYLNLNYRGTMVSSHVVSVPKNAVNNTWMRANLGWSSGGDPCDDPCESYWSYGNVVDREIGTLTQPRIKDINITGPPGNESYPMTKQDVKVEAIITEAEGYEVYKISWWGEVENVEGPPDTYNPHTYVPAGEEHGRKIAVASIYYRNTQTGEEGVNTKSKLFNLFFAKYDDDDGDGEPNWFEYWKGDGTVPNMINARYDATDDGYGYCTAAGQVYLSPYAAGQHYNNAIVLNTHFGTESFGGPGVKGSDSVAEIIAHELYHKWVGDQWNTGGQFYNKTDSDKNYMSAGVDSDGYLRNYDDELPDFYETDTSHTSPVNNTDTYDLKTKKHRDYKFYGDQEYMAMRTGNGARADANKDWANPGKQTVGIGAAYIYAPEIGIADTGFADGKLTGSFSDEGNDTDGNDLYDYLQVRVGINVTNAGLFRILAFLNDASGNEITHVSTDFIFNSGIQNIRLQFDGIKAREHGVDGPYIVNLTLGDEEGNTLDESGYFTYTYKSSDFDMSATGLTGSYTESATDIDSDGIYEYLSINVGLNVVKSGTYELEGWLYDGSGEDIGYAKNSKSLGTGIQSMKLNFSGTAIGNNRANGPYMLKYLKLTDSNEKRVDFVVEAHNTSAYSYTKFMKNRGGAKFENKYRDYTPDTDMDEIYDGITIEIGINVSSSGNYTLTGILYDKNDVNISMVTTESSLSTGNQTMVLSFNGDDVYNSNVNGPYILKYLVLQNNNGTQADYMEEAYNTTAYNYTYFASKPLVSLSGKYSDNGLDINQDDLYEYLSIGIGIQVASNGNVIANVRLMDVYDNEIQWSANTSYLYANTSNMVIFKFNGTMIHDNLIDGPYYLKDLYIYHTGDPDKSIYIENAYTTSVYSYTDFKGSGITTTTTTSTTTTSTTSTTSITSTTTTLPGCGLKGDKDCNGEVSDFELLAYISDWANSLVGDFDLLDAINNWAGG